MFDSGENKEMKDHVDKMEIEEAAKILGCSKDETEFHERFTILTRMHFDEPFRNGVVKNFKPPYKI